MSFSLFLGLDPVFFLERARTSWGRKDKIGQLRVRTDPPEYRRKLLTSLGHPGVYCGLDGCDNLSAK